MQKCHFLDTFYKFFRRFEIFRNKKTLENKGFQWWAVGDSNPGPTD